MSVTSQRLLIIADDLTGAADAGAAVLNSRLGAECLVVPWRGESSDSQAAGAWQRADDIHQPSILCISTDSRNIKSTEASARVRNAVEWSHGRGFRLFKKIDSLLRGHVAAELETFMKASPSRACLLAPALPSQGRTTRDGVQFDNDVPVAKSQARLDPYAPPLVSKLHLLAPARVKVHHLGLSAVSSDFLSQQLAEYVTLGGLIIADSLTAEDLKALHDCALEIEGLDLAGTSGLFTPDPPAIVNSWTEIDRPTIVVSASRRAEVEEQCDALARRLGQSCRIVIHPNNCPTVDELVQELEKGMRDSNVCVVTVAPSVALANAEDDRREVAEVLLRTLGEAVSKVIPGVLRRALVVLIGGDLSQAVCQRWKVESLSVAGTAPEGSVVCSVTDRSDLADLCLILRSGGFGGQKALVDLLIDDREATTKGGPMSWFV